MQTQLSQFCDHFVATVEPLLGPIVRAVDALTDRPEDRGGDVRTELTDLHGQIGSLTQKVAGQRSFLLIFGPLKSGKSTLMNALAASYVSEVSSLPAYPCLVFVSYGPKNEFVVTTYDGSIETYTDPSAVHDRIEAAHADLAVRIREAEDDGDVFDPQTHFPAAIRRVDVKVPAANLEASGAVLVDTPGLYTRMRFGYDRMTRDFRNAAACAIFVVKSDTLFLEQVFEEFAQLLQLFNRIFLVVNMDSTKRDVGPDGHLVPSLEQEDPERIIRAFEELAMPTPLKRAAEEGRVRIFPVDLMEAAGATLRGESVVSPRFDQFRTELHAYLSSEDYLLAFLTDSMQRAQHLVEEASQLANSPFMAELRDEIERVEDLRADNERELQRLNDCRQRNWSTACDPFAKEISGELQRAARDLGARVTRDMSASIETWLLSSHSLQWLLDTVWSPLILDFHEGLDTAARRCLEQSLFHDNAGLALEPEVSDFLREIGVDIAELRQAAIADLETRPCPARAKFPLDIDEIPLKRNMLDIVSFRKTDKIREKLFGPKDNPDHKISARQKAARLGEPAKRYLNQFLLNYKEQFFKKSIQASRKRYADDVDHGTIQRLKKQLQDVTPAFEERIAAAQDRVRELRALTAPLEELDAAATSVGAKVHALDTQFTATDLQVLLTPQAPRQKSPPQGKATAGDGAGPSPSKAARKAKGKGKGR